MPLSERHRCIFVHVPKAAGTSIAALLWHSSVPPVHTPEPDRAALFGVYDANTGESYQHYTAAQIRAHLNNDTLFRSYFRFAFVRNPWARFLSEYRWRLQNKLSVCGTTSFREFVCAIGAGARPAPRDHWREQYQFVVDDDSGALLVDFIGRFEQLEAHLTYVRRALNLDPNIPTPYTQATRPAAAATDTNADAYRSAYGDETRDVVACMYARDVQFFNYTF